MNTTGKNVLALTALLLIVAASIAVHVPLWQHDTQQAQDDVYYTWMEGQRLLAGVNPYARTLEGNMQVNQKFATYFPGFYLLSALTQRAGLADYGPWIGFWRPVFLLFTVGIALLLFWAFYRSQQLVLALFAAAYWLLNRWTLLLTRIGHIDALALFFLVLSLLIFRRHRWLSLLLFGVSLSIKQLAIFIAPLYLIWSWQQSRQEGTDPLRMTILAALAMASIPVLVSLPFLIRSPEAFLRSIFFSVTRLPDGHINVPSLDGVVTTVWPAFSGTWTRLPMLSLMGLIYVGGAQRVLGRYTAVVLVMSVFLCFNPVLFFQYIVWILPFLPLIVHDMAQAQISGPRLSVGQR